MDTSSMFLQMNMQHHMQTLLHQSISTGYPLFDTLIVLLTVPFIIQMIQNQSFSLYMEKVKSWWYHKQISKNYTAIYEGSSERNPMGNPIMGSVYTNNQNSFTFRSIIVYLNHKGAFQNCEEVHSFTCFGTDDVDMIDSIDKNYTLNIPTQAIEWEDITFSFSSHSEERKNEKVTDRIKKVIFSTVTLKCDDKEIMEDFVNKAIMYYKQILYPPDDDDEKEKELCKYYRVSDHKKLFGFDDDKAPWPNRTFKSIFFPEKNQLIRSLDDFSQRKGVFDESFEHPYRMGLIFHGPPGTGKTSLIKAIIRYTQRYPIFIPLSKLKKASDLTNLFTSSYLSFAEKNDDYIYKRMIPFSKRLYIFEDVDTESNLLISREKKKEKSKTAVPEKEQNQQWYKDFKDFIEKSDITLSTILNGLDGVIEPNGLMYILTTNKLEDFDEAVLRPGRIFMNLKMDYMTDDNIVKLLNYRFKTEEVGIMDIPKHGHLTPAQVENICQQSASLSDTLLALAKT